MAYGWSAAIVLALVIQAAARSVAANADLVVQSRKRELLQDIVTWDEVSSVDCRNQVKSVV